MSTKSLYGKVSLRAKYKSFHSFSFIRIQKEEKQKNTYTLTHLTLSTHHLHLYVSTVNTNKKYVCIYEITMQSKCFRVFLQIRLSFMLSSILVFLFQKYKWNA